MQNPVIKVGRIVKAKKVPLHLRFQEEEERRKKEAVVPLLKE